MATPVKRIEKDFLLKVLYDEKIPVMCLKGQTQYILKQDKPTKGQINFISDRPIEEIKVRKKIDLVFDYRGQVITFSAEVLDFKDTRITVKEPVFLYKDLARSFARVSAAPKFDVQFTLAGDRYSLSYPKVDEYEVTSEEDFLKNIDPKNLSGLIDQMSEWIKGFASSCKLVVFKDVKPESIEERLLAETGKAFYLPSTQAPFPDEDPHPRKRFITSEIFRRYLESTGVEPRFLDDACERFVKRKFEDGIFSDLWIPILFQEYVVGYIHIWTNSETEPPFDYSVVETLFQFTKILANSLWMNGYFEAGKMKKESFEGKIIDISASGLLFSYPHSPLASTMIPDSEITVQLAVPRRSVHCKAKIVRRYKDATLGYFGCNFLDMAPEDMRFLFEYIYGKPFTDSDAGLLAGHV